MAPEIAASPMSMSRSQQLQQKKSSFRYSDDLEAGSEDQPQCRICPESDGRGDPPLPQHPCLPLARCSRRQEQLL